ncbi:MAG: DUF2974 domain-containing protein [Ruminococcaceae bacterium]|nr:DUF2974 domain-containing protein [Oscillospiraceae bacterium]
MADLFDYLHWRGDLTFSQVPPGPVDALIFSALSYLTFRGSVAERPDIPISLQEASEEFFTGCDQEDRCRVKVDLSLLMAASETKRFGNTLLLQYRDILIPEEDTQFAAITFLLDNSSAFLAFRGTDYSLTGWKEDFNMSFQESVPAQRLAAEYVEDISLRYPMPLYLGGHSKGGNLAVYAAAKSPAPIRDRIRAVYNHDGPGFTSSVMKDPGYLEIVPRIQTIIPQSSVIGMLLEHEEPYTVVKSKQIGLLQHDFYSWVLDGPDFVPMDRVSEDSKFLDLTIKEWLSGMTNQERNEIVDAVFDLLAIGEVNSVFDLIHPKNVRTYLKTLSTDGKLRRMFSEEFMSLMEAARKTQLALEEQPEQSADETEKPGGS